METFGELVRQLGINTLATVDVMDKVIAMGEPENRETADIRARLLEHAQTLGKLHLQLIDEISETQPDWREIIYASEALENDNAKDI